MAHLRPRIVQAHINDALRFSPLVGILGQRQVGKTTLVERLTSQYVTLDSPDALSAAELTPSTFLSQWNGLTAIDECQKAPALFPALKILVQKDKRPGQFLLTGSIRATTELSTWAGTGRVVRLAMYPLTEREIAGDGLGDDLVTRLVDGWLDAIPYRLPTLDIDAYMRLALRGSFPELAFVERTARQRRLWLDSYLDDLVTRDVESSGAARDPVRLRRFVTTLALNLAGQPSDASLVRDAGINAKTAAAYDRALTNLAILDIVPAWNSNRLKRLTKASKRYLIDTALAAAAADVTEQDILRDSDLRGRWFDAFAAMQLRADLAAASPRRAMHHLRVEGGRHEVDLVVDLGRGRLFGIEFKAATAPTRQDARHLIWLRDELGTNFAGGVVLHSGQGVFELDTRIAAVPLSAVWVDPR